MTSTLFIITTIRHELGLDRPVSVSSCSPFTGLPSRLRPFGLYVSIISGIPLLILFICRSQFDLYLLSFSSTGSTCSSFKISSFLLCTKRCTRLLFLNFSCSCQSLYTLFLWVRVSLPCKRMRIASPLYTFILENFWVNVGLKMLLRIPSIWKKF